MFGSVRPSVFLSIHVCVYQPRSRGDNTFGSVRLSVNALTPELFFYWHGVVDIGTWLCQVQQNVQ